MVRSCEDDWTSEIEMASFAFADPIEISSRPRLHKMNAVGWHSHSSEELAMAVVQRRKISAIADGATAPVESEQEITGVQL